MERQIKIIPCIYGGKPAEAAKAYDHSGADAVGYYDEKITAETVKAVSYTHLTLPTTSRV